MSDQRYHRHTLLPGWNQARLAEARVIVMGLGALGNAVAQALALAGVGRLILCDMDRIERSNLSRAPLFREADLGRHKVDAAAAALCALAPGLVVETRPQRLEHGVGLAELRDARLVLGCLDSRATRLELAGRCGLVRALWIDGATGPWSGEVRPYLDSDGPCYGCGMEEATRAEDDAPRSCRIPGGPGPAGATAPLSLLVGALKVIEGTNGLVTAVHQARDATCPFHHPLPATRRLSLTHRSTVGELMDALDAGAAPLAWQPFEVARRCRRCGFREAHYGIPGEADCPHCGAPLQIRTHLELDRAPRAIPLNQLGVAPGEILPVRSGGGSSNDCAHPPVVAPGEILSVRSGGAIGYVELQTRETLRST